MPSKASLYEIVMYQVILSFIHMDGLVRKFGSDKFGMSLGFEEPMYLGEFLATLPKVDEVKGLKGYRLEVAMFIAIREDRPEYIRPLMDNGLLLTDDLLEYAARLKHWDVVMQLIECGGNANVILPVAVQEGNFTVVQKALEAGANPNVQVPDGLSPDECTNFLKYAIDLNQLQVARNVVEQVKLRGPLPRQNSYSYDPDISNYAHTVGAKEIYDVLIANRNLNIWQLPINAFMAGTKLQLPVSSKKPRMQQFKEDNISGLYQTALPALAAGVVASRYLLGSALPDRKRWSKWEEIQWSPLFTLSSRGERVISKGTIELLQALSMIKKEVKKGTISEDDICDKWP